MHARPPRFRRRVGIAAALVITTAIAACSPQLVPPYNETIHKGALSLEEDFVKFAATMQQVAGTPEAYYAKHRGAYADFAARLAVLRRRSETAPGGVPCQKALEVSRRTAGITTSPIASRAADRASEAGLEGASCVTILVALAQRQIERLRGQHEERCAPSKPRELCTTLFGSAPIYGIFAANTGAGISNAPLVSAVAISLDELAGSQEDLKPAPRS